MARTTSITLGDHLSKFVENQVSIGRFESSSEVVRAALRLLEDYELRIEALRHDLKQGEESGPAEAFDFDDYIAGKKAATGQ